MLLLFECKGFITGFASSPQFFNCGILTTVTTFGWPFHCLLYPSFLTLLLASLQGQQVAFLVGHILCTFVGQYWHCTSVMG